MMENVTENNEEQNTIDKAVAEGGAYEILNKRLQDQGSRLQTFTQELNNRRLKEFGDSKMEVVGRIRIRTENNCEPRDIIRVGDCLLLGYNVFIGLKKETTISDVFSLYRLVETEDGYDAEPVSIEESKFLTDPRFVTDFNELYTYYKNTKLLQLVVRNGKLLAAFQIGERITDMRVFRWSLPADGKTENAQYIDNRGDQDIVLPSPYDFEWSPTTRDMIIDTAKRLYMNLLNTLFIEHNKGILSVKLENNTQDGEVIHTEKLEDENQSLGDLRVEFVELGSLILLKILPYREQNWRYLVYNKLTKKMVRIDALGLACIQLPEDHGIIFPGGYYLQNGDYKTFDIPMDDMVFERSIRSPNGEDVLYAFYEHDSGSSILLNYDVIARELQAPIFGHGYARYEDGRMVIFTSESAEPTRIHPMQIWETPYYTDEFAANQPVHSGFFGKVGNIDLVRGISDFYELSREIASPSISVQRYTALCQSVRRLFDAYHWINDPELKEFPTLLKEVSATAELVLDEYEKVENIRAQSTRSLTEAQNKQKALFSQIIPDNWTKIQEFVGALNDITAQRGFLLTIREYRYMDVAAIDALEEELLAVQETTANATAQFLASEKALDPFTEQLNKLNDEAQAAQTVNILQTSIEAMQTMANDLDMLTSLMGTLQIEDATQRTSIIESISAVYAKLNQCKARAEQRKKTLVSGETVAQFGAQFQLFSQSITSALSLAQDPEKCDEQLSRLLIQLEELESQFGEHEEFLADVLGKREEVLETFETHKQSLLDERQRKAQNIQDAALRILETIPRRIERLNKPEEINAFFASDPLILKLRELTARLRDLHDSMRADDIEARLKNTRDQAVRSLRDKTELFEDGGNVIKLGPRHRFSVNTQELDLTLLPRNNQLYVHLTGTDFFEPLNDPEFEKLRDYWQVAYESETPDFYRAEYLVAQIIIAAREHKENLSLDLLRQQLSQFDILSKTVRDFAAPRYKDGYEKGIHDHDATLILTQLLPVSENAGLLRYAPLARAIACLYWQHIRTDETNSMLWIERAKSSYSIQNIFGRSEGMLQLQAEIATNIEDWTQENKLPHIADDVDEAAAYLVQVLAADRLEITLSKYGKLLSERLKTRLMEEHILSDFEHALQRLNERVDAKWNQIDNALRGLCQADETLTEFAEYIPEATVLFMLDSRFPMRFTETDLRFTVENMMGTHPLIVDQRMTLSVDGLFRRARYHINVFTKNLQHYQELRQKVVNERRNAIRLDEFKPRPLTSFVRNKLINEVYLSIIGDNLAKQMGTVGDSKRTDLMGLLMLISPPGYGKTTLMEYVANRLGLIFMKINGPALGHRVHSLDPKQAPDATSSQELEKLNLALEMGNNVMLYVDDIQHTSAEFLQKFISLCDGTRRIEGVWEGQSKTYDMRGRRFCVVMAGNPYTESGEVFKIPDMLANRADIYNLGETLGGMHDAFELSYIENTLTSNPILAPLATRDMEDVYRFVAKTEGKEVPNSEFSYDYSAAEMNEIIATLQRLMSIRNVVTKVNSQYITSAAQNDEYRTEPAFKLQGSYRNMNKMAEKISAVMNDEELKQLIDDHYQGESQLLTTGAEENLLKLAELREIMTPEQVDRWTQIKQDFLRKKALGGSDDTGSQVVAQLHDLVRTFNEFSHFVGNKPEPQPVPWEKVFDSLGKLTPESTPWEKLFDSLGKLAPESIPWQDIIQNMEKLAEPKPLPVIPAPNVSLNLTTQPQPGLTEVFSSMAEMLEKGLIPMIRLMDKKLDVDLRTKKNIVSLANGFRELANQLGKKNVIEVMNDTSNVEEFYGKEQQ